MMKQVIFIRHGKAADHADYDTDFERPLVKKGEEDVREMATKLLKAAFFPDVILASPALRTRQTAAIVQEVFALENPVDFQPAFYGGSASDYLNAINKQNSGVIMCVGHNPELGRLAMHYSSGKIMHYPTSAISVFEFTDEIITPASGAKMCYYDLRLKQD